MEATLLEAGGNGADFLTLPPEAIARQITRIDNDLFQRVKALDFLKTVWGAKLQSSAFTVAASNEGQGPTAVDQWPKRFNQLSFWVATEVCTTPELKARVQVVEKLIKVLKVG